MKIGVYISVCEEDRQFFNNFFAEIDRLNLDYAVHLDRCSEETKNRFTQNKHCVGSTINDNPDRDFKETDKQGIFDIIYKSHKYDWALAWDVDETWSKNFNEITYPFLEKTDADYIDTKWVNLWNDAQHIRVDGPFSAGHRVKFYRCELKWKWRFSHPITNGLKHTIPHEEPKEAKNFEIVCLHWGMMTKEMRQLHKERWDRIYTKIVGNNPYGFWNYALDETNYPPVIKENIYL